MIVTLSTVIKGCCVWRPVSALLMTLPRTGWLLTVRLLPAALGHTDVETHVSVNAVHVASPPTMCTWTTNDDLRLRWRRSAAAVIGGS